MEDFVEKAISESIYSHVLECSLKVMKEASTFPLMVRLGILASPLIELKAKRRPVNCICSNQTNRSSLSTVSMIRCGKNIMRTFLVKLV